MDERYTEKMDSSLLKEWMVDTKANIAIYIKTAKQVGEADKSEW